METPSGKNAVVVSNVFKSYGSGKSKLLVLQDLNMTVPSGSIYGLLGPSGCGKTTLLRCIVGRLKVDDGTLTTLGRVPGSACHEVPGRRVGYMPQELALFNHFSIGETLTYFGRLHKMKSSAISDRTSFLLEFLNLPHKQKLISELSGGQQRRTSFSIALLHEPELLILDEPTVGVDPLLRQRIWEHMIEIVSSGRVTIMITTHYVEEARQAHMVGMMRGGRLLAEAPPTSLLESYSASSLEDVFLGLCKVDDNDENDVHSERNLPKKRHDRSDVEGARPDETEGLLTNHQSEETCSNIAFNSSIDAEEITFKKRCMFRMPSPANLFALMMKNLIILKRQIGLLIFQFILPSFQIVLFCVCIGRAPYDLSIAVVNNETCSSPFTSASCQFLQHINNHTIIQKDFGHNLTDAVHSVKEGHNWGVISIGENFTESLITRFTNPKSITNETIRGSTVELYLDTTNQQISLSIQMDITNGFENFVQDMLKLAHMNPSAASIPVQVVERVYGPENPSFTNFMAPGIILSITFFMATGLTALSFVLERKQGLLDRSLAAGVSTVEIMIGHIATQFLVMLGQVALLLVFVLAVFKVPYEGSLALVIILTLLQGLTGMALGLLISTLCYEETSAIQCALGSVYPNLLLSGIIWPLESMPVWLRYISYCLPMTYAAEAMRSILARGWGLEYMSVWLGFVSSIGWGWFLMLLSAIVLAISRQ